MNTITEVESIYDDMAHHSKEAAKLPLSFFTMTIDQQLFFRDLYESIVDNADTGTHEEMLEDLNLIKSDLEAVIENFKK